MRYQVLKEIKWLQWWSRSCYVRALYGINLSSLPRFLLSFCTTWMLITELYISCTTRLGPFCCLSWLYYVTKRVIANITYFLINLCVHLITWSLSLFYMTHRQNKKYYLERSVRHASYDKLWIEFCLKSTKQYIIPSNESGICSHFNPNK